MSQDVNDVQVGEGEDVKVKIEDPDEILVVAVIEKKRSSRRQTPKSATGSKDGDAKGGSGSKPPPPFTDNTEQRRRAIMDMRNERRRLQRASEAPEKKKETLRKNMERARLRRANQTPEQKRAILDKESERRRKCEIKWKHLTDEELGEEVKQILIERRDKWMHKVAWEEGPDGKLLMSRADMQRVKCNYQNFTRKKKMTEEELARAKEVEQFHRFAWRAHMSEDEKQRLNLQKYLYRHATMASMSKDEREIWLRKRREMRKLRMSNWTEEQKQRHKENVRKALRRYHQKEKNREKLNKWQLERLKNQTPEQRQQTLLYHRINQAKRLLKKKLEKAGVAPGNIKEQVDQLVVKMRSEPLPPPETVSKYKPRPKRRKNQRKPTETLESSKMEARTSIVDVHNIISEQADSSTSQSSFYQQGSEGVDPISNHGTEESRLDNFEYFCGTDDDPHSPPAGSPLPPQSVSELSPAVADDDESSEQEQNLQKESIFSSTIHTEQTAVPEEPIEPQPHSPLPSSSSPLLIQSLVDTQTTPQLSSTSSSSINCPHCPSSFPQITELHPHLRSTHPKKCWKCPKCFAVVLSPQELTEHFKSHHTSSKASVKHEDLKEPSREPNQNKRPGRRKTAPAPVKTFPFSCLKCPMRSRSYKSTRFENHEKLTQHVRVAHPKSFFPCRQCKLLKYNSSSLEIHLKICTKKLKS